MGMFEHIFGSDEVLNPDAKRTKKDTVRRIEAIRKTKKFQAETSEGINACLQQYLEGTDADSQ